MLLSRHLQLYKDNLEPDLAPFQKRGGWGIEDFKDFVKVSRASDGMGRHGSGE